MEEHHERYPGKPYFLFIADYGPVGDKLSMGDGYNGARFPYNASDRFSRLEDVHEVYNKLLYYVKDKITQALKGMGGDETKRNPSFYQWK